MAAETLTINNFGPITQAQLEIKRYTLFIGLQASGKSTAAKLLAAFRDIAFIDKRNHHKKDSTEHFKKYNLHSFFGEKTYLKYACSRYVITFIGDQWKIELSAEFELEIAKEQERLKTYFKTIIKSPAHQNDNSEITDESYLLRYFEENWKEWFDVLRHQIYIPAERNFFSLIVESPFTFGTAPLPQCTRDFGRFFDIARNSTVNFDIDYLSLKIGGEKGKIKVYTTSTNTIPLSESASGIQAVVPLHLVVNYFRGGNFTFITEEPELNLFPTTQKSLINFLVGACRWRLNQSELLITTHSPYVLTALNLLLYAYKVSKNKPEKAKEINEISPMLSWINPDDFSGYYFGGGGVKSIVDENTKLISDNELDAVSVEMKEEFYALKDINDGR